MSTGEMVKSKKFKLAAAIIGAILIAFVSFAGGVKVGLRKAKFSYQWGHNYERNFMGLGRMNEPMNHYDEFGQMAEKRFASAIPTGRGGMFDLPKNIEGRDFRNAHGLAGTIISIADNNLIIKDRDDKENTVAVNERTVIKDHMLDIKIDDLKIDDQIVVMGRPDEQGLIKADLIRVFCCNEPAKEKNDNNNQ